MSNVGPLKDLERFSLKTERKSTGGLNPFFCYLKRCSYKENC